MSDIEPTPFNAVIIVPDDPDIRVTTINGFHELRERIDCSMVEHVKRTIRGTVYDLWLDEEGKLTGKPFAVYDQEYEQHFAGNVVITRADPSKEDLELLPLTNQDISNALAYAQLGRWLT